MERQSHVSEVENPEIFRQKLLTWANGESEQVAFLDSNHFESSTCDCLCAAGALEEFSVETGAGPELLADFDGFLQKDKDWRFGYLSYDLKNALENLSSGKPDRIGFPVVHFFRPQYIFLLKGKELTFLAPRSTASPQSILEAIKHTPVENRKQASDIRMRARISHDDYRQTFRQIQSHIARGDIYEMNFCQEFYAEQQALHPVQTYLALLDKTPAPFSCFYRNGRRYLLSASPERYLRKTGNRIYSQPMKGTIRRGTDIEEDEKLKVQLSTDPKEQSENVMIVDLVRNDLSRIARRGTVQVDELCGIYSFPRVHQMISTVSAELREGVSFSDCIRATFPMGSMTGAPKIRAMELIEQYESTRRGLFSGAVGYINPEGDFDFNVVIRSMLYNATEQYLSMMAGSAITIHSDAEREYEECLLKMSSVFSPVENKAATTG